jgi:hypothetical protein
MQILVAWLVMPAVLLALAFGLGGLLATLTRLELPVVLLAPVGAALAIVLTFTGYVAGLHGILTPIAVALLAVAGLVTGLRGDRRLPRPGPGALVFGATYGLYLAPVVLSGHAVWLGYDFVNDTSPQLLLTGWLTEHARELPPTFVTTTMDSIQGYLITGYPLGSHALLGALHELLGVRADVIYQPFIASFAALGATALYALVRQLTGTFWAALVAFAAVASNLLYQYALQGNMKEIVTAALLATTAAVAAWSLRALRALEPGERGRALIGSAVVLAVPVSATVDVLSTAGLPYVGLIVLIWLVALLALRVVPGPRALAVALAAGAGALVAGVVLMIPKMITFGKVTSSLYAGGASGSDLGQLSGPLQVRQTAGVWLVGDYRGAPVGLHATLTTIGVWLVVALAVVAVVWMVRRRNLSVLVFALPVIVIMLLVTPRTSPYADAKTYMLMAPGVTLLGALGAAALGQWRAPLGLLAVGAVLAGVLGSDAFAYHDVHLAPTQRMAALRDLDAHFKGQGPILFNEPEEFAKNFMDDTKINVGAENVTPAQTQLRVPQPFSYLWFDLDDLKLSYVERFPLLAVRRSPVNSRPPSNYRLVYRNAYYEMWRRSPAPRVLEHASLQGVHQPAGVSRCADIAGLARRARGDQRLIAATAPDLVQLDTGRAKRSPGWVPHPYRPNMVVTTTPGEASARVRIARAGRYRAWIAGSFGRTVTGWIDGRRIGSARGVDNVGQWSDIGALDVPAGRHLLRLSRGGGDLRPGDGFEGELGPLALERVAPRPLVEVRPDQARARLCGRRWDWIERVSP